MSGQKKIYWILWAGAGLGMGYAFLAKNWDFPCVVREKIGLYCPGCGATRAVEALMQGEFLMAGWLYPAVLWCVLWMGLFLFTNTVEYLSKGKWKIGILYHNWYLYVTGILIVGTFLVKNLLLIWTGIYWFG